MPILWMVRGVEKFCSTPNPEPTPTVPNKPKMEQCKITIDGYGDCIPVDKCILTGTCEDDNKPLPEEGGSSSSSSGGSTSGGMISSSSSSTSSSSSSSTSSGSTSSTGGSSTGSTSGSSTSGSSTSSTGGSSTSGSGTSSNGGGVVPSPGGNTDDITEATNTAGWKFVPVGKTADIMNNNWKIKGW